MNLTPVQDSIQLFSFVSCEAIRLQVFDRVPQGFSVLPCLRPLQHPHPHPRVPVTPAEEIRTSLL